VQALDTDTAKRVWRIECEPGQEAQIDYGTRYMPIGENGRLKKKKVPCAVGLALPLAQELRGGGAPPEHREFPDKGFSFAALDSRAFGEFNHKNCRKRAKISTKYNFMSV